MDLKIKKLIDTGTIICGRIIEENGIIRFERIEPSQIENIPENERGFATASMGRAIFTIDKDGSIHNFKGVDSHLSTSELGPMDLVNAKSIEYAPRTDGYKVSAVVFNDKKPEIRINGTSPLEDIEIEGDINKRLAEMGIKVPTIRYIREIPQDFSMKYGLPIKVEGSLDEFESDYAVEDDKRKKRLEEIYGSNYSQSLGENQRPESMREYLQRIGFLSSPEVQANIESLGYSMQDFIEAVDSSYSRGQRYGQAERIMGSPFRISDLETCIANGNKEQLQAIIDFSEMQNGNFTEQLAEVFGRNIAILMSNGWECENLVHRQDFSLAGEFCDDSYFDIFEKQEDMKEKYKAEDTPLTRLVGRYVNNLIDYNVFEKAVKELYADKEENKPLLKEFDLEAAKAGKHVCTRDGKKVRIICFDKQEGFPIIALVETKVNDRVSEEIALFNINGRAVSDDIDSKLDLMMSTEKKEGWVNIYHDREGNVYTDENVYNREKDAINFCPHDKCRVATVKVGWEE